ncbi:kelch-like protein 40a [Astyanax mexicanus]|uniref:Kelch-like protein 40a n=2 Tax=Astyanax mexicanus TaxID=7994 RepID=A0A8B9GMZ0_ASTMX|nr:kelch-like protein 40a [Astyanax mexicanus]KAG9278451.1 kelch-like protein 40a [Astyanax mexicanus]
MAAEPVDPVTEPRMFQQTLLQDGLCELLENDKFVDCVLKIKDREFPCHRLVLAASSPYFKAMFLSDMEESKKREVVLQDVEPSIMGMILRYIYTSDINLTEQNVQDIFMVANMYQIPSIFSVCMTYLEQKMVLSNCLAILRLGLLLECPRLAVKARDFICDRFELIVRDQDFHQLGSAELAAIITCDSLNVEKEETVFEALMGWVEHDPRERLKDLKDLLHCIRFRLMPQVYFKEKVEGHKLIRPNQEIKTELQLIKDAHKGLLPKVQRSSGKEAGASAAGEEEDEDEEEEGLLPGILNNNPRFGMFQTDFILMISNTGTVAYDPVENECFMASSSNDIPKNHCSLVTKGNQIFVAGGLVYSEQSKEDPFSSYFLQFDPMSCEWLGMPSLPNPRCLFGLAEAQNSIFVVGGKELKEGEHALDSVMIYDRQSFKWGESDPLPYSVYGHGTVSHNGLVYVLGGKSESKKCLRRVCVYNPTKFEWKDLAPMKMARSLFGVAVHKDKIYVVTGVTDNGLTSSSEVYDIASNTWSEFTEFPQERSSLNLTELAGSLYAVGGFAMMHNDTTEKMEPTEMNDIWRFDEGENCWNGMLREISYASGATVLGVHLNALRLTKM